MFWDFCRHPSDPQVMSRSGLQNCAAKRVFWFYVPLAADNCTPLKASVCSKAALRRSPTSISAVQGFEKLLSILNLHAEGSSNLPDAEQWRPVSRPKRSRSTLPRNCGCLQEPRSRQIFLKDRAIVCANCHAMIHRNGDCRPLERLISQSFVSRRRSIGACT
jgi:hypothetical protein